ncbi:probable disease resistance protein At4g27220 [Vitis riparia]|uniref:probable disease resistance protein At4g27220 n=1 Tax=Vitis riparia TaxID=96939 RepID=UPI00155ADD2B|nr:probable disease resistance protein At4g27220 [Vitis riparia]XP_034680444.1 probable disease resistance protein At4g27220 [Vitis riparia]
MEYVDAILTSIGLLKDMWSSISDCFNYQKILDENCTTLREKMERLKCREHDINIELEDAQYDHRKKEKKEVENWLIELQHMKDRTQKIEQEATKKRWFSRLRFLSQFEANIKKVDELLELGKFPDGILIDVHQDEGMTLLTTQLIGETTAKRNLEKIWACLEKGEIRSIGVWGMGGIGKTTIITHIYNRLLENSSTFGHVYWVTVSKESSTRDLQDAIAKKLNIDFSEEGDDNKRSALLFKALQKLKKFVLIFDDMWEVHEPEQVGIPLGVDGGKLIITTRSRNICLRIGCEEIIKVESFCIEESWELFNKTLGRYSALKGEEEEIAKDIVKKCAGLPLAIVTTAKSMRGVYDICEWRNALNELRGRTQGLTIDIENDVFKILEFSYNRLNDETLRECLLYCTLFPEDHMIRRVFLIKCWIGEGMVGEIPTRQAEFDRGHAILNKLENVCLLERCENGKCVKMHDLIRDMVINISKRNSRFMVRASRNLNDLSSEIQWLEDLERVSLLNSQLSSLKSVPNCPKLSTMILVSKSGPDEGLPNAFFVHMPSLKVLDLSYSNISSLPDSISNLVNLRALFLFHCDKLNHVPSLAKLKELRELDLSESGMTELPDGIEQLALLKCLAFRGLSIKDMSLNRALPNLLHLQCLRLDDMRFFIVGIEELIGLRKLEILCINLSSLHKFDSYMRTKHYQRLTHYYFQICGGVWPPGNSPGREVDNYQRWDGGPRLRNSLGKEIALFRCELNQGREDNDECQLMLPTNIQLLEITECSLPTCLLDVSPSLKIARDLKVCSISKCKGVEHLWCMEDCVASLNSLYLDGLPDLNVLFKSGPINIVSCSSLKHLEVKRCGNLKHLFTHELVNHHLQNLQTIYVNSCKQMEDIIVATEIEEEGEEIDEMNNLLLYFPNLKRLTLLDLPELKSIWKGTMTHDSLQELEVWNCPKLRRLPLSVHITDGDGERRASTSPLKKIMGEVNWWESLAWDTHPHAQFVFQPLPSYILDLLWGLNKASQSTALSKILKQNITTLIAETI